MRQSIATALVLIFILSGLPISAESRLPLVPISFLPDGSVLFTARMQKGKGAILVLDNGFRDWKVLYEGNGELLEPALSYDRKAIVFSERLNSKAFRLCILNIADAKLTPIRTEPNPITSQQFSPAADRVVYATQQSEIRSQIVEIDVGTGKSNVLTGDEGMYVSPFYSPSTGNLICARLSRIKRNSPIASPGWHRLELLEFGSNGIRQRGIMDEDTLVGPPKVFAGSTTCVIENRAGLCYVFFFRSDDKIAQIARSFFSMHIYDAWPCQTDQQVLLAKYTHGSNGLNYLISSLRASNVESTMVDINKLLPTIQHLQFARFVASDDCSRIVLSMHGSGDTLPPSALLRAIVPSTGEVLILPLPNGLTKP